MAVTTSRRRAPRLPAAVRREQILDAALRLVIDHGFAAISMEGVARQVGVAKTVVYEAFPNTDELLRALLHREESWVIAEVARIVPDSPTGLEPETMQCPAQPSGGRLTSADPDAGRKLFVNGVVGVLRSVRRRPDGWRLFLLPPDGTPPALRRRVSNRRKELLRQLEPLIAWAGRSWPALAALDPELTARLMLGLVEEAARLTLERPRHFTPERVRDFMTSLLALAGPTRQE